MNMVLSTIQLITLDTLAVETSILPENMCVMGLLLLVLKILVYGLGAAAVIGVVIAGIQYMTARDDQTQVAKAKKRLLNIAIGLIAWALMWAIMNWLIPGGMSLDLSQSYTEVCPDEAANVGHNNGSWLGDTSQWWSSNHQGQGSGSGGGSLATTHYKNPYASGMYTNNKNGLTFQLYEQCNSEWGSLPIATEKKGMQNMCSWGCNVIAAASVISAFDPSITPKDLYDKGGPGWWVNTYAEKAGVSSKVSCTSTGGGWSSIKEALQKGGAAVLTTKGHYIALLDINSSGDQVFIGNSYKAETTRQSLYHTGWANISDLGSSPQYTFVCYKK